MKKNKLLLGSLSLTFLTLTSLSCQNIREKREKDTYIKQYNRENFYKNKDFYYNKKVENDFESLIHNPLIRYEYQDNINYDNVNKTFIHPTRKKLSFNLIEKIILSIKGETDKEYNNDDKDLFLPPQNKNLGYNSGIISYFSKNKSNINHPDFLKNLQRAYKIRFVLKKDIYFINNKGEKTNKELSPKNYLKTFAKNLKDFQEIMNSFNLNYKTTLNSKGNFLDFEQKNINYANKMVSFLNNQIITNLLFNPTYLEENENNYFIGNYYLKENTLNSQTFHINNYFYLNKSTKNKLKKIILKYNPLPLDRETFSLQSFNSYRQNLISETDFDHFNKKQQNEIYYNKKLYGLNYQLKSSTNNIPINTFYNFIFDNKNSIKFNDIFSELFYGLDKKEIIEGKNILKTYNQKNQYLFRSILSLMINKITYLKKLNYDNLWNSYVPENLELDGNDIENSSYKKAYDAKNYLSSEYGIDGNLINENNYKKSFYDYKNLIDIFKQYQGINFEKTKEMLNKIIDDLYAEKNYDKNQKIEFTIPIFENENDDLKQIYDILISLFKKIDKRINPSYEFVKNSDDQYFINYQKISLVENSISNFLKQMFFENNNSWLLMLTFIEEDKLFGNELIREIKNFKNDFLKKQTNVFDKLKGIQLKKGFSLKRYLFSTNEEYYEFEQKLDTYLKKLTSWEQIKLLLQLNNLVRIPFNTQNYSNSEKYEQILVQNYLIKPINDLGYTQFQDIKLKK